MCFIADYAVHGAEQGGAEDPRQGKKGRGALGRIAAFQFRLVIVHAHKNIGFIWPHRGTIEVVHIRLCHWLNAQGKSVADLPLRAMWNPYGTYAALAANTFLVFFQGFSLFLCPFSASNFVINYILLPMLVTLPVVYKFGVVQVGTNWRMMDFWVGQMVEGLGARDKEGRFDKNGLTDAEKSSWLIPSK